jgi:hypothetical protein
MIKHVLILCLSFVFCVSISAADLQASEALHDVQIPVQVDSVSCDEAETLESKVLSGFEPIKIDGDQLTSGCCKVCKKGKACGDSCIARNKTCHKGRGCACDG